MKDLRKLASSGCALCHKVALSAIAICFYKDYTEDIHNLRGVVHMATTKPTGWVGWVYFASVMIFIAGSIQLLAGFVALFKDDFYLTTAQGLIAFDYSQWGWIHILLGLCSMAVSWAIATGKFWGRLVGIALAVLNLLSNAAFLPAYPLWSIIVITVDLLVIYALTLHGSEAKA